MAIPDAEISTVRVVAVAVCCGWMIHPTAKVSEEVNRELRARNTMIQFLTIYTQPAIIHSVTDRRTDGQIKKTVAGRHRMDKETTAEWRPTALARDRSQWKAMVHWIHGPLPSAMRAGVEARNSNVVNGKCLRRHAPSCIIIFINRTLGRRRSVAPISLAWSVRVRLRGSEVPFSTDRGCRWAVTNLVQPSLPCLGRSGRLRALVVNFFCRGRRLYNSKYSSNIPSKSQLRLSSNIFS